MTSPSSDSAVPRTPELDRLARCLEMTGAYRVLRRLEPRIDDPFPEIPDTRLALYLDVETTGLDPNLDEIIELAVVPLRYTVSGEIVTVGRPVSQFRQPSRPISPQVSALTGIDDALVAGHSVDAALLSPLLAPRPLTIAHNAAFDRVFVEKLLPDFADLPWACSMCEVPWRDEGATALKLPILAADAGFFYDAHRASDDCLAAIELLRRPLPRSGRPAFAELLKAARRDSFRVMAVGAPFEARASLKGRRYSWSAGGGGQPKCWYRVVAPDEVDAERTWLREEVYHANVDLPVVRLTAWTRYSSRGEQAAPEADIERGPAMYGRPGAHDTGIRDSSMPDPAVRGEERR